MNEPMNASAATPPTADTLNHVMQHRVEKRQALEAMGLNPYPYRFEPTHNAQALQQQYATLEAGTETQDAARVAGRVMALRNSGLFLEVMDTTGKLQVFCHKESLAPEAGLDWLKLVDIGDMIGAEGTIRRTPRGELSLRATTLTLLSKNMAPLPEKYHGLTDMEARYRQRYVDLIMNEDSRNTLRLRCTMVSQLRQALLQRGFMEVETPMLHPIAGGAAARPFVTHHNSLDANFYLRIAPELSLKRLIVGGLSDKIFEINRCFRNEGIDTRHNPEFTSIELYQAYADYNDMMRLTEELVEALALTLLGTTTITYQQHTIELKAPWRRATMAELVQEATGVDFMALPSVEAAHQAAATLGISVKSSAKWGEVLEAVFGETVEKTLIQPTHVTDLPKDISPLAKVHRSNPLLAERFETYVNGWELANAFSELSDPADQRLRFEEQVAQREGGDGEAHCMDEDYINALNYGLPPTGGMGMGLDRLAMLLGNAASIRDVILFPTLRPLTPKASKPAEGLTP